jgi:hypothetical protein
MQYEYAPRLFISYWAKDRPLAERLAESLRARSFIVESDMDLRVGEDFELELRRMRENARFIVAVMTPGYFRSGFTESEWRFALERERAEKRVLLLPALFEKCDIPDPLRGKHYADFREEG